MKGNPSSLRYLKAMRDCTTETAMRVCFMLGTQSSRRPADTEVALMDIISSPDGTILNDPNLRVTSVMSSATAAE